MFGFDDDDWAWVAIEFDRYARSANQRRRINIIDGPEQCISWRLFFFHFYRNDLNIGTAIDIRDVRICAWRISAYARSIVNYLKGSDCGVSWHKCTNQVAKVFANTNKTDQR